VSPYQYHGLKVLVVDDEATYRRRLRLFLRHRGANVRTAADAPRALKLAAQFSPDILIVDWMLMNRVDGLDLAQSLREARPQLQTIVITGYLSPELDERVRQLPNTCWLSKPFQAGTLLELVHRLGLIARANADS